MKPHRCFKTYRIWGFFFPFKNQIWHSACYTVTSHALLTVALLVLLEVVFFLILYRKSELKCMYSVPFDYIPERAQTTAFSSHMCIANWVERQVQNCPVAIPSGRKARTEAREGLWPAKPNRWFGFFFNAEENSNICSMSS